jgi:hypothetical protein
MSKTLAADIAGRTLQVVNPMNRSIALSAALRRHGFDPTVATAPAPLTGRTELVAWLLASFAPRV